MIVSLANYELAKQAQLEQDCITDSIDQGVEDAIKGLPDFKRIVEDPLYRVSLVKELLKMSAEMRGRYHQQQTHAYGSWGASFDSSNTSEIGEF